MCTYYICTYKTLIMWVRTFSTVTTEVTKEQMWKLYANVNEWHLWDDEIDYAKMEGPFAQGNTFKLKPKKGPLVTIELKEVNPFVSFTDLTRFPLAKMYGEHTFTDTAKGLEIKTTMRVTGPLHFLWVKLVAGNIAAGLEAETKKQIEYAKKNL